MEDVKRVCERYEVTQVCKGFSFKEVILFVEVEVQDVMFLDFT